ncbi:hypothetical protein MMC16_004601 [Acarospora aff. strigata]|nr:hypothetical protein [Acarospora aff. strigata]
MPLEGQYLPSGLSQIRCIPLEYHDGSAPENAKSSFLSTSSMSTGFTEGITQAQVEITSSTVTDEEVLSQFYEQSFAIHENTASSQIDVQDVGPIGAEDSSAAISNTSFLTCTSSSDSFGSAAAVLHEHTPILTSGRINNLKEVPAASYVRSILPQTMTVNLVVGIISVSPSRTIRTKQGGREMQLVEMLVGDETKAGFSINFWLPPVPRPRGRSQVQTNLSDVLECLRRQDIVLIRNVALNTFMGKVYGQSLRKDMTKLNLLYRSVEDGIPNVGVYRLASPTDGQDTDPQADKMSRVKDWVMTFVGSVPRSKSTAVNGGEPEQSKKAKRKQEQMLPPDTQ